MSALEADFLPEHVSLTRCQIHFPLPSFLSICRPPACYKKCFFGCRNPQSHKVANWYNWQRRG